MDHVLQRLEKEGNWAEVARYATRRSDAKGITEALRQLMIELGKDGSQVLFSIDGVFSQPEISATGLLHTIGPLAKVRIVWPLGLECRWSSSIAKQYVCLCIAMAALELDRYVDKSGTTRTSKALRSLKEALFFATQADIVTGTITGLCAKTHLVLNGSTHVCAKMTAHLTRLLYAVINQNPRTLGVATTASAARAGIQSTGNSRAVRLGQTHLLVATLIGGEKGIQICRDELFTTHVV